MRSLALLALLLSGCAHAVMLDSQPQGALVEVDGSIIGKTPVAFVDRAAFKHTYAVTLKLEGYKPRRLLLTQEFQPTTLCCPVLLPVGWQLPEEHYLWPLERDDGAPAPIPGLVPP